MALRKPVVVNAGELQQIQVGDTLDATVDPVATIDKIMTSGGPDPEILFDVDGSIMIHIPSP